MTVMRAAPVILQGQLGYLADRDDRYSAWAPRAFPGFARFFPA
jgi:hypothetical protein